MKLKETKYCFKLSKGIRGKVMTKSGYKYNTVIVSGRVKCDHLNFEGHKYVFSFSRSRKAESTKKRGEKKLHSFCLPFERKMKKRLSDNNSSVPKISENEDPVI